MGSLRSSHPEVFLGKGVLKICSKFTGQHLCRSAISIKLLCNFIEIALWHECSVNLLHIFRRPFPKNISGWLLLRDPMTDDCLQTTASDLSIASFISWNISNSISCIINLNSFLSYIKFFLHIYNAEFIFSTEQEGYKSRSFTTLSKYLLNLSTISYFLTKLPVACFFEKKYAHVSQNDLKS